MPMITKKQSFKPNNATVLALLFIFTFFAGAAMPKAALAFLPQTLVSKAADDDFDRIFREGKDLVDKEEWAKAAEKFSEAVNTYPKNKSADAALYWLAFSYKQQKAYKQAGETLDRLLKEFPASPWVEDARVMKMEIAPAAITNRRAPTTDVQRALETVETATTYSNAKLAREDEIRLAAFQSLLSADAGRAVEAVGGLLRADSKASETLKKEALRSVTKARFLKESRLGQSMPELRETLIRGFQNESNIKIRKEIIYTLANIYDEQSIRFLSELYIFESSKEIKKTIIDSFNNPSRNLYGANRKLSPKVALLRKIEFERLMEILRTDSDVELRRLAFYKMQRIGISKPLAGQAGITADALSELYDAERDEELKISFIRFLKDMKENQATRKLLEIAKNGKSDKLRLEAVYALRTSKDPEVLKFLEELIK